MFRMKYLIALSGGLDSITLLHLFHTLSDATCHLRALHVHHGLHPEADAWVKHCESVCAKLGIPFEVFYVTLPKQPKEGLEAAARTARYKIFSEQLLENEVLVTAHHQNDQAETFLLQALRGSGPKGLSGMPRLKKFSQGWHWRPLLDLSREALEDFVKEKNLSFIEDDSNFSLQFDRNYLRYDVIPLLKKRWPKMIENFARSAKIQAELASELDALLEPVWQKWPHAIQNLTVDNEYKNLYPNLILPLPLFDSLSQVLQNWLMRSWIKNALDISLSRAQLNRIWQEVIYARQDKQPKFKIGEYYLRRYANALWLTPIAPEKIRIPRTVGGSLKKLWQNKKIPPWERD